MHQVPELGDAAGDRTVEPVAGKVQALEGGEGAEGGDEAAGEEVSGEREFAKRAHAREGGELDLPSKAEAVEEDDDDGGAEGVAGNAVPGGGAGGGRGAAVVGFRRLRRSPGGENDAGGVGNDALLELEEAADVVRDGRREMAEGQREEEEIERKETEIHLSSLSCPSNLLGKAVPEIEKP